MLIKILAGSSGSMNFDKNNNLTASAYDVGGRMVHFLLQLSERWPCNILAC